MGAELSAAAAKYHQFIDIFCERLNAIVAWDAVAAEYFARLQASLLAAGTPIGDNDAMIAGHAQSTESVLVSNNQKHFGKMSNLALENWVE